MVMENYDKPGDFGGTVLYCTFLLRPRQIEEFHSTYSDAQSMQRL